MRKASERVYARPRPYLRKIEERRVGYSVLDGEGTPMMSCVRIERAYEYAGEYADRKGETTQILCLETLRYEGGKQSYDREMWREAVRPWAEVKVNVTVRTRTSALAERVAA